MKMIVNACYGGYEISDEALAKYGISDEMRYDELRTHPELVAAVERGENISSCFYSELEIVEIPDETTDYMIQEYDGLETVYYVLNGKIHEAISW